MKIFKLVTILNSLILLFGIASLGFSQINQVEEINLSPYLELLDSSWNSKNINEVENAFEWMNAYSVTGKEKMVYEGNWYRLKLNSWIPDGNWVLIHPLSAKFELFRKIEDKYMVSEHGYLADDPKRITYRKTAVFLNSLKSGEVIYFRTKGISKRSSHHPILQSPNYFLKILSRESPINSFFYSVIFIVSLISLFAYKMLKEKIYLNYSMYLIASLGVFLGIQGYIFQYTTLWNPSYSISFFGLVNFFIILFVYDLFEVRSKIQIILSFIIAAVSLLFSLFSLIGLTKLAFEGLYTIVIASQFFIIVSCLGNAIMFKKNRLILILISLSFIISSLGLINDKIYVPYSDFIDAAYQPFALLEILLFGFVLLKRFYNINTEKQQALELARLKSIETLKLEADNERLSNSAQIGMLASQVSHDIRSPLSALTMLTGSLSEIPEDKRILVRSAINRITDIANNLLEKSKAQYSKNKNTRSNTYEITNQYHIDKDINEFQVVLLSSLLDSLISEKRIQFRDKNNLQIQAHFENSYGVFVNIIPSDLSRVLSNIINNSVESFDLNKMSTIDVTVDSSNSHVEIKITDNGKGIPNDVLVKLGQKGVSFGKEGTLSGSGLGVYHAKQTIESFNGSYQIHSDEGVGTSVIFTLPKANAPQWFVQRINLIEGQTIVAIDDDRSVLEIWKQRFDLLIENNKINLLTFSSSAQLGKWISENKSRLELALFLVDYEFLDQSMNGLELIEKFSISSQSILVTSRYEEKNILSKCHELKIKLIPKGMAPVVPIKIEDKNQKIDLCLIDDDYLVRMNWSFAANSKGLNLICFESEEDFLLKQDSLNFNTPIYIDVCLKKNVNGEDVASRISQLGFKNLHLATGYESDQINKPKSVLSIIGKDFPL